MMHLCWEACVAVSATSSERSIHGHGLLTLSYIQRAEVSAIRQVMLLGRGWSSYRQGLGGLVSFALQLCSFHLTPQVAMEVASVRAEYNSKMLDLGYHGDFKGYRRMLRHARKLADGASQPASAGVNSSSNGKDNDADK
jgi:hypothetical protein